MRYLSSVTLTKYTKIEIHNPCNFIKIWGEDPTKIRLCFRPKADSISENKNIVTDITRDGLGLRAWH